MPNHAGRPCRIAASCLVALGMAAPAGQAQAQVLAQAHGPVAAIDAHGRTASCPANSAVAITAPPTPLPTADESKALRKFTFIAYGDTRGRHDGESIQAEHQLVVESMLATIRARAATGDPVRFVVQTGDAARVGASAVQWNVSYVPLINRLTTEGGVHYFFTVGNHDVTKFEDMTSPTRFAGLCNVLSANANLIPADGQPHRLAGYPTYGFGLGNTWFIAFDSNIAGDPIQFAWMKSELAALDRRRYPNVVTFSHQPAFSSGPHGGPLVEPQTLEMRSMYMPLFRRHHVRLVLTGHEHFYEHWVERYTDATGPHRLDQIVTGGGGAPLYGFTGDPDLRSYLAANQAAKLSLEHLVRPGLHPGSTPFHYMVIHVDGEEISVEVIGVDWGSWFAPYGGKTGRVVFLTDTVVKQKR